MAGYVQGLPPNTSPALGHVAWLVEGKVLDWPSGGKDFVEKHFTGTFNAKYKQDSDSYDVLRFTKTKEMPCTATFVDGCGVTHKVVVNADDEFMIIIPLPDETFTRHVHTYKQIVWKFDNKGEDLTEERSCTEPGSTLAECTFSYQPASTFHNHGIRIRVQAYSLTERSPNHNDQEKAFWEGDILKEAAPFLHKYYKLLQEHTVKGTEDATALMKSVGGDPMAMLGKMIQEAATLQAEQARKQVELNKELIPLIRKSFTHHDKTGHFALDKDEAATFFSHVVDEQGLFLEVTTAIAMNQGIEQMMKSMADMAKMMGQKVDRKAIKEDAQIQIDSQLAQVKALVHQAVDEYKKDKATKDAKAFKVLDTSGTGTLKLDEVVAAMTPGSSKHREFLDTLGFGGALAGMGTGKMQQNPFDGPAPGCDFGENLVEGCQQQ